MIRFEWDPAKAGANLVKHGATFEDAQLVWDDPNHVHWLEGYENGEERWRIIGYAYGVVILVAWRTFSHHRRAQGGEDGAKGV